MRMILSGLWAGRRRDDRVVRGIGVGTDYDCDYDDDDDDVVHG